MINNFSKAIFIFVIASGLASMSGCYTSKAFHTAQYRVKIVNAKQQPIEGVALRVHEYDVSCFSFRPRPPHSFPFEEIEGTSIHPNRETTTRPSKGEVLKHKGQILRSDQNGEIVFHHFRRGREFTEFGFGFRYPRYRVQLIKNGRELGAFIYPNAFNESHEVIQPSFKKKITYPRYGTTHEIDVPIIKKTIQVKGN